MWVPNLTIQNLADVLPHMTEGIRLLERDGYYVVDYTFAGPETFINPISTECRGLKFDRDGLLVARPLHKFFNVGERQSADEIRWSEPHRVYEKLDGSMIHGCMLNGDLVFMTRGGVSPQATMALKRAPQGARALAEDAALHGRTAVFEFTSPDNRIVVPYRDDALTLLAVRENFSGRYLSHDEVAGYADRFDVALVRSFDPITDHERFIAEARAITGAEGYVIAFDDGHRLKIKGEEYAYRHKALATMASEKNVLRIVLDNTLDDVSPLLAPVIRERLTDYALEVRAVLRQHEATVSAFAAENRHLPRKDFALKAKAELDTRIMCGAFAALDGKDVSETLSSVLRRASGSGAKLEAVRDLIPAEWSLDDIPMHELSGV